MIPVIKVRNEKGKTIKKLSIENQGFINLDEENLKFTNNYLDFKNHPNIIEFSYKNNTLSLLIKSKTKNLALKKKLEKKKNPIMSIYKNSHNLNIKDIIYTKKSVYLTKLTNIDNIFNIDMINSSLKDTDISHLNDSWVFGESIKPIFNRCSYCKELDNNLIQVCKCKTVHKRCFMEIFSSLTKKICTKNFLKIEVNNFFCNECGCDFEPFYKVDESYQCFLNMAKTKFLNCVFLIKKNTKIIKEKKFVGILFFNLSEKKNFYFKKHFKFKIKDSELQIKGIIKKNTFIYSPHQFIIKSKYLRRSFFLINNKEYHFRFKVKNNFFTSLRNSICNSNNKNKKNKSKYENQNTKFSNFVTFGTMDEYVSNA